MVRTKKESIHGTIVSIGRELRISWDRATRSGAYVADLYVHPFDLYQQFNYIAEDPYYIIAANGIVHKEKSVLQEYPFIWCERLRNAIVKTLHAQSARLLLKQTEYGTGLSNT